MTFKMGDVVRFKKREVHKGLFEVAGLFLSGTYDYSVTNDECDTELYANKDELLLVCSISDRKDLDA